MEAFECIFFRQDNTNYLLLHYDLQIYFDFFSLIIEINTLRETTVANQTHHGQMWPACSSSVKASHNSVLDSIDLHYCTNQMIYSTILYTYRESNEFKSHEM